MEIKAALSEALNAIGRARTLNPPKSDIEELAIRWELYASLQNVLDALAMIVSDLGLGNPSSYADLDFSLHETNLVDRELCDDVRAIAVARNILAHAYRRLSFSDLDDIVRNILQKAEKIIRVSERLLNEKNMDPESSILMNLSSVFEKHGIELAYPFGSRAKGLEKPGSDRDIAVLFNKSIFSILDEINLAMDIERELDLPADKVDVVALDKADPLLKLRIINEGISICVKNCKLKKWIEKHLEALHTLDLHAIYIQRTLGRIINEKSKR
jgi:hypothetical protein